MANEVRIEARPWEPQDLIDDLQLMIDEEPDNYLNANRATLCMARDYLKKFFAEESLRPKGRWISVEDRLPHAEYGESDNVLAVDGHGIVEMLYFDGGCWCYPTGEPVFCEDPSWRITHWMPMPEPPRED